VTNPILYIIPEDIKKPHVPQNMKESSMEKHRSEKREKLLKCGKVSGKFRIRISYGNKTKEEKGLFQMGALNEFP
jgi:hypothetical protein